VLEDAIGGQGAALVTGDNPFRFIGSA